MLKDAVFLPSPWDTDPRKGPTTCTTSCSASTRRPSRLAFVPWLQAFGGNTEVSLSYQSVEAIRGRSHRACGWCMILDNSCIFVGEENNPFPFGVYLAVCSTCFCLTVTYCIYYSCGGRNDFSSLHFEQCLILKLTATITKTTRPPHIKAAWPSNIWKQWNPVWKDFPLNGNFHSSYLRKGKLWITFLQNIVFT